MLKTELLGQGSAGEGLRGSPSGTVARWPWLVGCSLWERQPTVFCSSMENVDATDILETK